MGLLDLADLYWLLPTLAQSAEFSNLISHAVLIKFFYFSISTALTVVSARQITASDTFISIMPTPLLELEWRMKK